MELLPTTPRKAKVERHHKSVAPPLSRMGFCNDVQREVLPIACTAETPFEDGVLKDCVRKARKPLEFSDSCVTNKCQSVSAYLQAVL